MIPQPSYSVALTRARSVAISLCDDQFLSLIEADPALAREIGSAASAGDETALSVQRFVELGERYGCRFTADELRARLRARPSSLSDAELEHVSGGAAPAPTAGSGFMIEIEGLSLHRGGGFNELSLDDTAGKEK